MSLRIIIVVFITYIGHAYTAAVAQTLPDEVEQALEAAIGTHNSFVIDAVKARATNQYPKLASQIQSYTKKEVTSAPKATVDIKEESPSPFSGEVELGFNLTSGNTEKEELNAATKLTYEYNNFLNTLTLEAQNSKENQVRGEEQYDITNQTRYNLSNDDYAFLELDYTNDRFGGIQHRTSEALGYGYYFINNKTIKLSGEASIGARQQKQTNGKKDNNMIQKLAGNFDWKINEYLTFSQKASTAFGSDTTVTESESSLKTKIIDSVYLKLAFDLEHVSEVPQGKENTDTETNFSIVYDF